MLCKLDDLLENIMEGWLLILEITQICLQCLAISLKELWVGAYQFAVEIKEIRLQFLVISS